MNPEGGCVPADTPTRKHIAWPRLLMGRETNADQRPNGTGHVLWALLDGPKEDILNVLGIFRPRHDVDEARVHCSLVVTGSVNFAVDFAHLLTRSRFSTRFPRVSTRSARSGGRDLKGQAASSSSATCVMAANEIQRRIPVEDNIDWVADDPRTTPSRFELGDVYPENMWTDVEDEGHANWEVRIPGARQRICSAFKNGGFPMYQIAFEHMGWRLPFSDLEYRKFFEIFEESLRGFKDEWFVVRPMTSEGWKTILVRGYKVDNEGRLEHGDEDRNMPLKDSTETKMGCQKRRGGRMGSWNVVAKSSVAVFKLLEVTTFLNGRECKYLQERDEARAHAKDFRERLSMLENDLSSETKALKESQERVTKLEKDLQDAKEEKERLKGKVVELEEQVSRLSIGPAVEEEEEKRLDPEGTYAKSSRADLIAKIYQISDLQLDVASSSFKNAFAQLQVLNPDIQLVTEGMDKMKEVRDGRIATPPLEEKE
ncbi:hypothetical protein TSUD_133940 [Trifolium subterraneum]|uniref:Uncharacterized protein n=1 Tax=Trifolium subterraneum TaxID=3900 RepID=A0A2Z6P250_TRISU|nr:hypothetical protein TSUD_133940 [Trifolium subterraneum]